MTRRSTPQSKTDDLNFPVRIFIAVPTLGFGIEMDAMYRWLNKLPKGSYAWHGGGRLGIIYRCALYFRRPEVAVAFLQAFPQLQLAEEASTVDKLP